MQKILMYRLNDFYATLPGQVLCLQKKKFWRSLVSQNVYFKPQYPNLRLSNMSKLFTPTGGMPVKNISFSVLIQRIEPLKPQSITQSRSLHSTATYGGDFHTAAPLQFLEKISRRFFRQSNSLNFESNVELCQNWSYEILLYLCVKQFLSFMLC